MRRPTQLRYYFIPAILIGLAIVYWRIALLVGVLGGFCLAWNYWMIRGD